LQESSPDFSQAVGLDDRHGVSLASGVGRTEAARQPTTSAAS
jgi:hypothetical protein